MSHQTRKTDFPAGPSQSESQASAALRAGGLVAIGTETVYGLFADLRQAQGLERLRMASAALGSSANRERDMHPVIAAWHAPEIGTVLDALGSLAPVHRRLIERLAPGPVTFRVEQDAAARAHTRERLGLAAEGACGMHDAGSAWVRVPGLEATRRVLKAAGVPICGLGIGLPSGGWAVEAGEAADALARAGIGVDALVDTGRSERGKPSDRLALRADGRYALERGHIFDEAYVSRRLERTVLLVCTGNTCRSPMAEAIARGLFEAGIAGARGAVPTRFVSAGVAASDGAGYSPETEAAVRKLGFAPPRGASRALTASLLANADEVWVMTRSHLTAVVAMDKGGAGKVSLLDPEGGEVPDPMGGSQGRYDAVAERMRAMLHRRLGALDT